MGSVVELAQMMVIARVKVKAPENKTEAPANESTAKAQNREIDPARRSDSKTEGRGRASIVLRCQ